jgi:phosphohistidine phosphatase SixA
VFTLVRHAHAGEKKLWTLPDQLRPLSVHGWQQAEALIDTLAGRPASRLLSSPYLRCQQTLLPLAARLEAPVEDCDLLAPHADTADLDEFLADPALEGATLCTHGETLTALLDRWHRRGGVALPFGSGPLPTGATEKGAAWIVDDDGNGRSATYRPPRSPSAYGLALSGATRRDVRVAQ